MIELLSANDLLHHGQLALFAFESEFDEVMP